MKIIEYIKNALKNLNTSDIKSQNDIDYIRIQYIVKILLAEGIRANYDPPTNGTNRMILYTTAVTEDNYELLSQCNGLVIDYKNLIPICVPPPIILHIDKIPEEIKLAEYTIQDAYDGTIINLYYHMGNWVISTFKGQNMNNKIWNGIKYIDALNEIKSEYKISDDKFDHNKTYTIGISHPKMHAVNNRRAWFVSAYSLSNGKRLYNDEDDIGFPVANFHIWNTSIKIETAAKESKDAGLILRNPLGGYLSNLYIESDRMKIKRRILYSDQLTKHADEFAIDREKYITLVCFLNPKKSAFYLDLYSEDRNKYDEWEKKLLTTVDNIKTSGPKSKFEKQIISDFNRSIDLCSKEELTNYIRSTQHILAWYYYLWPPAEVDSAFDLWIPVGV